MCHSLALFTYRKREFAQHIPLWHFSLQANLAILCLINHFVPILGFWFGEQIFHFNF